MASSTAKIDFVKILRSVESQKTSTDLEFFYKNAQRIQNSEVLTRLIHRVSLSIRTIPQEFNNCAGNFSSFARNNVIAIIGEKPAAISPLQKSYPFLDIAGSSGWLNCALNKTPAREDKLFWVNALNFDDSKNNPEIINQLNPKHVICLGKVAEKWATENGWDFKAFPHPQYWKRFKSKEPYPLIEFLNKSLKQT